MISKVISLLFTDRVRLNKDLARFAEIEYTKEDPQYIVHLINTGQILKN